MTDTQNPDWVAWLARAEAEACGEDDDLPPLDFTGHLSEAAEVPLATWRRLGDLLPKIVAGAIGGSVPLLLLGEFLYLWRLFG